MTHFTAGALIGIALALPIVIAGNANVLAISSWAGIDIDPAGAKPGIAAMVQLALWMYRSASQKGERMKPDRRRIFVML